jgi:hypothetical protein
LARGRGAVAIGVIAAVVALGGSTGAAGAAGGAHVRPNTVGMLDCNGFSPIQRTAKLTMVCADPAILHQRFEDHGHYIGHDEPSLRFISSRPGSGSDVTWTERLPVEPSALPTTGHPGSDVTHTFELSLAPWFSMNLCDPKSDPQVPCTPRSDANAPHGSFPGGGNAFMELQFYPPGFAPFDDSISCDNTHWCSALTIDSVECDAAGSCNNNCIEPVNFAFLQTNGVPAGPPAPQTATLRSMLGNGKTLKLNPGDVLKVSISDPPSGLTTVVRDLTTGRTGYMTASARNGFMNTSMSNCDGHPFTFHAEYNTARKQNMVPWTALEAGVLMEQEIGHFETCGSLRYRDGFKLTGAGQSYVDPKVYQTCMGGSEGRHSRGEGPCSARTRLCSHAKTQGTTKPIACPTRDSGSGQLCEFADGYCFPKGSRRVLINGKPARESARVTGCFADQFQNGDLDFDGTPYQRNRWPDGSSKHPTPMRYLGPFDAAGQPYPQAQFETDIGGSEFLCNTTTGVNCTAPPLSAKFYPYWSLAQNQNLGGVPGSARVCLWNFGGTIPGQTVRDFGKDAQYGAPDLSFYGGTLISQVQPNPQFSGKCR